MAGFRAVAMKTPLALLLLGALAGCGVAAHAAGQPASAASATGPASTGLFHAHFNMAAPIRGGGCGDRPAGAGPPTLAEELRAVGRGDSFHRAAAIATVTSVGAAVWNTGDGHRWTQAEINAGTTVYPSIYTPYVLKIQRVLAGTRSLAVGQTITGYREGGTTAFGDSLTVCGYVPVTTPQPQPAWFGVVIFGGEVDTPTLSGPPRRPMITDLDVIQNGAVQTAQGQQPLP